MQVQGPNLSRNHRFSCIAVREREKKVILYFQSLQNQRVIVYCSQPQKKVNHLRIISFLK